MLTFILRSVPFLSQVPRNNLFFDHDFDTAFFFAVAASDILFLVLALAVQLIVSVSNFTTTILGKEKLIKIKQAVVLRMVEAFEMNYEMEQWGYPISI